MKQRYITPRLAHSHVSATQLVATSTLGINGNVTVQGSSGGWVKGDTLKAYDVWDDDWSAQ